MDNANISVMDEFVETMRKAFLLGNEIEGISSIEWHIKYSGATSATTEIAHRMNEAMEEAGMKVGEIKTTNTLKGLRG